MLQLQYSAPFAPFVGYDWSNRIATMPECAETQEEVLTAWGAVEGVLLD